VRTTRGVPHLQPGLDRCAERHNPVWVDGLPWDPAQQRRRQPPHRRHARRAAGEHDVRQLHAANPAVRQRPRHRLPQALEKWLGDALEGRFVQHCLGRQAADFERDDGLIRRAQAEPGLLRRPAQPGPDGAGGGVRIIGVGQRNPRRLLKPGHDGGIEVLATQEIVPCGGAYLHDAVE
jgi:NAD-specific glutamate dehydrogenase